MKKEQYMMQAVRLSLAGNIMLFIIKATALLIVNSLAIAVDLGISCVSLTISVILYYAIKLADKPADFFHNYGYGKVENVCEAMEGVILIGVALTMSFQAATSLFHPKEISLPWVGVASSSLGMLINFFGAYYIFQLAKKSSSPAIHAEAVHYRLEGVISAAIATSFVVVIILRLKGQFRIEPYVDPVTAFIVSLIIAIPSFNLAKNAFFKLLDSSIEEGSTIEVLKQLGQHAGLYCDFKDLKTRTAGRKKFVELRLVMPEEISFKKGHKIAAALEKDIKANIADSEVIITLEPCGRDCSYILKNKACPYI